MFKIEIDRERRLVVATMSGFMTADEVRAFSREEQAALMANGLGHRDYVLLVDASDCVIQSQEVVATFIDIVARSTRQARKIAIFRGCSLARAQAQRIARVREDAAVFSSLDEARQWLFGIEAPVTPAAVAQAASAR